MMHHGRPVFATNILMEELVFLKLKQTLAQGLALSLPNVTKQFHLYNYETQCIAKKSLTQTLKPWQSPLMYLSKHQDLVVSYCPSCFHAIAIITILVMEADKLTLRQDLTLTVPYAVETMIRGTNGQCMSNAYIIQYHSLLLYQPLLTFAAVQNLNLVILMPDDNSEIPHLGCEDLTGIS